MARSRKGTTAGAIVGCTYAVLMVSAAALAESPAPDPGTPYAAECEVASGIIEGEAPLPNVTAAIEQRKTIRILAIGASSTPRATGSYTEQITQLLERVVKGIDVVMINRGVSGELAANAAMRIRTDVALTRPDLVLWQVGTNDALAHIPLEQFEQTVVDTIRWLKEHRVDVVLAGLQYVDQMAQDAQYRAVRDLMRNIAAKENVIIVRRYEAMRLISWGAKLGGDLADDEFDRVAASDRCLAQYFARAITVGVFGKGLRAPSPQFRQ